MFACDKTCSLCSTAPALRLAWPSQVRLTPSDPRNDYRIATSQNHRGAHFNWKENREALPSDSAWFRQPCLDLCFNNVFSAQLKGSNTLPTLCLYLMERKGTQKKFRPSLSLHAFCMEDEAISQNVHLRSIWMESSILLIFCTCLFLYVHWKIVDDAPVQLSQMKWAVRACK